MRLPDGRNYDPSPVYLLELIKLIAERNADCRHENGEANISAIARRAGLRGEDRRLRHILYGDRYATYPEQYVLEALARK
jgi:hypothetical protein